MLLAALLCLFSTASVSSVSAQTQSAKPDIITLLNGDDINAVVQKIGDTEIEYKKWANKTGPAYTLKKSEIFRICYANGDKDVFFKKEDYAFVAPNQKQTNITQSTNASQQTAAGAQSNGTLPVVIATDIPSGQREACYSAIFVEMRTKGFSVQSEGYAAKKGLEKTQGIDADKFVKDHSKNVTPDDKYILVLITMKNQSSPWVRKASWTFRTFDMSTGNMLVEDKTNTTSSNPYGNWGDPAKEAISYFLAMHPTLVE
ncbi:hypothetical protein FACS1894201_01220 [Bacteroidia bacterium]|nr:hypothetical protein FACS1894201_01220 [Bacteroidia bacterium]